ncbi:MAG TPA: hypothetical protein VIG34_04665 [Xanthobacteraceae bacterium]|jgi:hypothetical protein
MRFVRILLSLLALILTLGSASAAPPTDCVRKFVGAWIVTVNATGQTYPSTIRADGTLSSVCPQCVPVQTWTCSGDTFILTGPGSAVHTLSPDGRRMTGSCCTVVRVGPSPVRVNAPATRTPSVRTETPNIPPPPPPTVRIEEPYIAPPPPPSVRTQEPRVAPRPKPAPPNVRVQEPRVAPRPKPAPPNVTVQEPRVAPPTPPTVRTVTPKTKTPTVNKPEPTSGNSNN